MVTDKQLAEWRTYDAKTLREDFTVEDLQGLLSEVRALRLAITQITSWQPMETAPIGTWVRLLVVDESGHRSVQDCSHDAQGWWIAGEGYQLTATPLAWRPADPTDLPEDFPQ